MNTIVFVTGIFDLLHVEHVRFLHAAKAVGDPSKPEGRSGARLIVGIECDERVKRLKGSTRPIMSSHDRKEMLQALSMVDKVIVLPEQFDTGADYEKILKDVKADVYAVSSGSPYLENKKRICEKAGVQFKVVHDYNPEYSTTKLIDKICVN